jgi:hypothetical protein
MCDSTRVSPAVTVLVADSVHVIGTWGRTFVQIWRGGTTRDTVAEMNRFAGQFVESKGSAATSLFIVERTSPPPDEASRKEIAKFSRDAAKNMSLSVVVAEGGGFRAALVRAVGVTLTTLLPHSSKFKFENDLDTAIRLLEPHLLPGTGGAGGLETAVEELRSKIGARQSD